MKYNVEWSTNNADWTVLVEGIVEQAAGSPLVQRNSWAHYSNQLTPGSTFYYRIIAINTSDEKSQPSVVGSAVAIARSGTGIVTSIRATRQSNTSIQVAWNAPTDLPTGVTTNGYIVFRSENQGDSWIPRQSTLNLVTGTQYTDTGLKTNTCYGFRALHIASNLSISHLSDEAYATTGTVTTPAKPTGLSATGDGASTFNISWTAPASNKCAPILGYHIQERANSGADWGDVVQDTFDDAVTYAHTGQTLTMSRQYRVRAENSAGWGAWSDVFTTQAPPGAPTGVIVTSTRANHTRIIWTAPTNTGSSAITSYTMEWSTDDTNWSVLATGIPVANNLVYNHYSRLLTVGDRFHYRVRAVNSAGTGPPSTSSSTLVVANSLTTGVPTGVTVSQTGAAQITVSWTAPTNLPSNDPVRSYVVFRTTNGGDSWALLSETVPPTTLTYADNSLTSGITYGYTVAVIVETSRRTSNLSVPNSLTLGAPGMPTGFTAASSGGTSIDLSWTAPTQTWGSAITGYKIEVSEDGTTFTELVDSQSGTTYSHTGLTTGDVRHYRVRAINARGTGQPSSVQRAIAGAPAAPTGLTAGALRLHNIVLNWDRTPTITPPITSHIIEWSTDDTNWEVVDQPAAGNTGYYEHFSSLLTVGETFYYRVRAVNSAGASPPSTSVSATAVSRASGAGVPTDVRALQTAAGEVTVSWTAPTDVPDAEGTTDVITYYQVYRTANSGKLWEQLDGSIINTASSYVDDDGLTVGNTYGYRVAVQTDAFIEYDLSPPDSLTVGAPSAPTSFTAVTASNRMGIDLSWSAPAQTWGSNVTGYQIEVSTDGDTFTELVASQTGTTYSHTGLSAGDVRHYRVRAINARGTGQPTAVQSITIGTPPGAPQSFAASAFRYHQAFLIWNVPSSNGSTAITSYTVEWSTDNSTWKELVTLPPTAREFYHYSSLLTPGESFYYRVSAVNSAGAGPASAVQSVTAVVFISTGVPTGVTVSQASATEVTVSWTAPTDLPMGEGINRYQVFRTSDGGDSWRALSTSLSSTTLTYTDSDGLTTGMTYGYRVNLWTTVATQKDLSIPASLTFGAPAAPTSLTSTPAATSIALSWTAPTQTWGSAITGYKIEVSEDGTTFTELVASQTGTTYSHTGLSAGDTRWYRVRAINARGAGAASSVLQASVTVPAAPTSLRVTTTAFHAITLQWDTSPATSLGGAAFKKHILEWSTDNTNWEVLAEPTNNTDSPAERHVSSLLTPGEEFYYRIKVVNADDVESPPSAVVTVTAVARSGTGIPTGVTATKNTGTSIDVAWVAPTDLPSGRTVMNYYVFRSNNDGDSWTLDSQVGASTLMITDTGLDTNTCYGYRVYMEDDEFEDSALSDEAYATTGTVAVPAAPTGLTATSDGTSTFNLAWTAPAVSDKCSVITGYEIEQSTDGGSNWTEVVDDTMDDGVTYAHTSQTLTTVRQYRVRAKNAGGFGTVWSNVVTAGMNTVPGPPGNLSATANGRTAITLSWDAPTNTGGADITGYRVQWSADQGSSWSDVDPAHTGTTRTYSHTGRSPNTRYDYQVYASNSQGESATASSSVSATTEATMAPDAPTAVSVTPSGRTILIVSWTAPADNGGEAITGYKIDVSTDGGTNYNPLVTNTRSTQTTYIHRGLSAGVTRHYQISAINSVNTGAASTAGMGTTVDGSTNTVPSDPTSLTATASGRTLIVLSWTAPSNNGGSAVSGYKIEWSADGTSNWAELEDDTKSTATTFIDRGLSAGSTRHYRVSAINTTNTGTASITASATTVDGSTNTIPSDPTGLNASANGPTTIVLSWTAPANTGGTAITGYHIEWSSDGTAGWADVMDDTESTSTTYSDTGLLGGATRHYRVYAINAQGESLPSNTDDATTAAAVRPGAPQNLVSTASGRTTINLKWDLPTSDGGARIRSYRIQWSADGNAPWTNVSPAHSGTDRTYSDTGLDPSTTRHYRVYASNSVGESTSASATDDATTAAVTATRPGPPGNLNATANGRTAIDLTWDAPTNTGGADITGYRIQWSADGNAPWTNVSPAHTGTDRTYSDTGLNPSTTRYYRVYVSNSVGESTSASTPANATTDAIMAPDAPTAVSVTPSGRTILVVSWTAPTDNGGAAIIGYRIEVSTDGGRSYTELVGNSGSSQTIHIHRGLSPGVTRHYRIGAINAQGTGMVSDVDDGTTVDRATPAIPSDPLELTATSTLPVVLSWRAPADNGGEVITGYQVQWSADGQPPWTPLGERQTSTTYTDHHSDRHYRVSAINRVGESLPSNVVTKAATQPQVRFTRASARIDETAGTYQVQVTGRPSVSYTLSGTAAQDADYTISDNLLITIVDDVDDEPNETIIITLTGDNLGRPYVFTLTIVDNDVPNLSFTQTVSNQSYLVGVDIKDLELPEARYGTRPYSYTLTPEIPKGLKFDARTLSGTPTEVMAPTIFTYTVTDANAQSATQTFTIEVKAPPSLTFAETVGDQRYPVQIPLADHVLPAATGGVAPYVYTLMPELPVGLTFDTQTRTLSGVTSEVAEAVTYTYTAQDRIGTRTEQTFSLEIYQMAFINKSIPDQSYPRGEPIAPWVLPEVSDGVPPIAYTLTLLDFPFNLRYNAQSRTIYGTPMEVTPPVPMTYTATDQNGAQDSLKFTIEILSPTQTEANQGVPQEFRVYANYPNPFDRSTHLVFDLPWAAQVQVEVLNVLGRRVMAIPAVQLSAGWRHELELTDLDLPSGPYLYRMIATSLDDQQSSVYTGHLMRVQ